MTFIGKMAGLRLGAFLILAASSRVGLEPVLKLPQSARPVPITAAWPFELERGVLLNEGEVRLTLQVERGQVVNATIVGDAPAQLIAPSLDAVRKWRFQPEVTTSLETMFRHRRAGDTGCGQDRNQTVTAQLPNAVEVVSRRNVSICDRAQTTLAVSPAVAEIKGHLSCACGSHEPISAAQITVSANQVGRRTEVVRTLLSDSSGGYRIGGLSPGEYVLQIRHARYQLTEVRFAIAVGGQTEPVDVDLQPEEEFKRPVTQVLSGSVPTYPAQALVAGIDGTVNLRLSMKGDQIIDLDSESSHPELAQAASSAVRTWKFGETTVPVVKIRFSYRIDPGDCKAAAGPSIAMQLPDSVEIRAVRPCSAGASLVVRLDTPSPRSVLNSDRSPVFQSIAQIVLGERPTSSK